MKTKRILSALLAALMLVSVSLVACSDGGEQQGEDTSAAGDTTVADTTTEAETENPLLKDELPTDVKFDGHNYTVLTKLMDASAVAWKIIDVFAEAETGERINDAVYKRNLEMAERFNVKVVMYAIDKNPHETAKTAITAGDETFDVIQHNSQKLGGLATGGYLMNMNNVKYLNFEKLWWDVDTVKAMALGGKTFIAGGSASLNMLRSTWGMFFNKRIVADAQIPDLYQTVRDGKWTLDLLKTYGKQVSKDVNGDGVYEYGVDTYGIGLQYEIVLPLFQSTGAKAVTVNKDGSYEVTLDSAKMMDTMEKIYNFMNVDSAFITNTDTRSESDKWVQMRNRFMEGLIVFYMGHLSTPVLIPDMKDDFGILPFPKVNETDEYASSFQYNNYDGISIPKIASNPDRTGMLTEAYTMMAYDTVREAWYDYTLTLRSARDNESGEMLDIIFGARGVDVGLLYHETTKLQTVLQDAMKATSFSWASTVAAEKDTLKANMQKVVDAIAKAEN